MQNLCPRFPFGLQFFYAVIFRLRAERLWHELRISARIHQSHEAKRFFFFGVYGRKHGWHILAGWGCRTRFAVELDVTKCYMAAMAAMDFAKSSRSLRLKIQHWKQ
jgi:hypothetical protein